MKLRDQLSELLESDEHLCERCLEERLAREVARREGFAEGFSEAKLKYSIEAFEEGQKAASPFRI